VEFAPGEFVSRRLLRSMAQYNDLSETYRALVLERGCVVGDNSFCACRVYAAGSRRDPALPGRANFHDPAALACLPEVRRDRILSAYPHIERESLSVLSVLLLPNSESLTRRALAGHGDYCTNLIAPYTLLTDLLGEKGGVLAVKPHPHGSFDFERYFEGAVILDKTFPVEFLYLIPGCRIGTLLSVETGGADKIAGTADRVVAAERYFMLNIHQMIGLRLAAALPALLPMRSLRFSSPQGEELAHVLNLLSRQIGMPEKAGLRPLSPGEETDVTVSFERPEGDVHRIHELSVLRRRTHPMSPVSEGRQSLYLTGELTEEELSGCRMHLELPYSRLKAELIPAGEET